MCEKRAGDRPLGNVEERMYYTLGSGLTSHLKPANRQLKVRPEHVVLCFFPDTICKGLRQIGLELDIPGIGALAMVVTVFVTYVPQIFPSL